MGISLNQLKSSLQRTKKYIDDKVVFSAPQIDPSTKNWILSGTDTGVSASVTAESTKLDYGMFTFAEDAPKTTPISVGDILPFSTKKIGTIEINPDTHGILLKKDKVYFMRCNTDIANASGIFTISFANLTTGNCLDTSAYRISANRNDTSSSSDLAIIYKPDEDCEVGVKTIYQSMSAFVYSYKPDKQNKISYLIAMEIGREHVTYPTISEETGNWVVNGEDTGVKAEGKSGVSIQDITKNSENNIVITFTDGTVKNIGNLGYTWDEIAGKPSTFQPSAHTHTKSQISDMPTKVSQFSNDAGYITSADVDTSQNHTHTNKAVLDKITQSVSDTWNAAYTHVSNKNNPHGVTPAQIGAASASHNHDGTYLKSTDSASDMVVNFDDTSKRENLVAGENIKTSFGKIKKWFSDMKTVAWTGNYNDLTNKPSIENISGIVSVAQGGTGAADAAGARTNLGAAAASHNHSAANITSGSLPIARGGTGAADVSTARTNLGLGVSATQNIANNCTITTEGYVLDARQGKVLKDEINKINENISNIGSVEGGHIISGISGAIPERDLTEVFAQEISNFNDEWAWIQHRIQTGNLYDIYIGDYIPITLSYTFNQTVYTHNNKMRIAGINTHKLPTTFNTNTINHIDFVSAYTISIINGMNMSKWFNDIEHMDSNGYKQIYRMSNLYSFLNNTIYPCLPQSAKNVIVEKMMPMESRKISNYTLPTAGETDKYINYSYGKLWVPTAYEIFGERADSFVNENVSYPFIQYPLYRNLQFRIAEDEREYGKDFLTASLAANSATECILADYMGDIIKESTTTSFNSIFCFRIT